MPNNNVISKIHEWLNKQGYPLEIRTASVFRDSGFDVYQSHYYPDPDDGTQREIDVLAIWPEHTGGLQISFSIECKKSSDKPWLLFASDETLTGRNVLFSYGIMSKSARSILVEKDGMRNKRPEFLDLPWMVKNGSVGYGLTQAFTNNEDFAYRATMGAMKCAIARKREGDSESWSPFVFAFPVIVIDGLLFECKLNDSNEIAVTEISDGNLFFPMSIAGESGTCINVVTVGQLPRFVAEAKNVAQTLNSYLKDDCLAKIRAI